MIVLHQFPRAFGLLNGSPFCMKVEVYLRLARVPHRIEPLLNPRKGPNGKLPFIRDGTRIVADSHFILRYLKETQGDPLDSGVDPVMAARHHALARMLEERTYWCMLHSRWADPRNAATVRDGLLGTVPRPMRGIAFALIARAQRRALKAQGTGRHAPAEIHDLGTADLEAAARTLGDRPFFGGNQPAGIDATAYAFLANILIAPVVGPMRDRGRALPHLVAYCDRMRALVDARDRTDPAGVGAL